MDRDALGAVSGGLSKRDRGKPTCRPAETDPAIDTHAHNGLFLAAPRRTGKPTFLQADLKPALEAAGAVVAYVDLWADPRRDPGSLIADAIARALAPRLGVVSRAAKAAVALIVDEARHALTSEAGDATMSALKPARDQLNRPGEVNPSTWLALRFYRGRVTPQMAQRALESLRERNPARVWKSARGEYAVDDAAMHRWFEQRVSEGRWPPVDDPLTAPPPRARASRPA
jgi:hypothetical protein